MELDTTKESDDSNFDYLKKIEETYVVKLIGGRHTTKGSFWAKDDLGNEFYLNRGLVSFNSEKINNLTNGTKFYFVLVQNIKWTSKWDHQNVNEVIMITDDPIACEKYKTMLKVSHELNLKVREKYKNLMEKYKVLRGKYKVLTELYESFKYPSKEIDATILELDIKYPSKEIDDTKLELDILLAKQEEYRLFFEKYKGGAVVRKK